MIKIYEALRQEELKAIEEARIKLEREKEEADERKRKEEEDTKRKATYLRRKTAEERLKQVFPCLQFFFF